MKNLKVFEGIPSPYDHIKRKVVPDALKVLRLQPHRKFTVVGELAQKVGWQKGELIERLEEKRKEKSKAFYEKRQERLNLYKEASQSQAVAALRTQLAELGY